MWHEYYRARLFARIAVLAFPIAIVVFVLVAPKNLARIWNLSDSRMLLLLLAIIGALALPFALPILHWVRWPCPRCGHPFAQPRSPIALVGPLTLIMLPISLWRLVFNGRCAQCGLRSGEPAR